MLTINQATALEEIGKASVACELETGLPAELTAAQCILESGWLAHAPENNCFGIKHTSGPDNYQMTQEFQDGTWRQCQQDFQAYPSLAACFEAHALLLQQGPYRSAWQQYQEDHNLENLLTGIALHYATDPGYEAKLASLAYNSQVQAVISRYRSNIT